jgi:hypothetical protein
MPQQFVMQGCVAWLKALADRHLSRQLRHPIMCTELNNAINMQNARLARLQIEIPMNAQTAIWPVLNQIAALKVKKRMR